MSAGKGDKPRPVKKETYDTNFDKIVWDHKRQDIKQIIKKGKSITVYK